MSDQASKKRTLPSDEELMTAAYHQPIPPELQGWTKNEKYDLNLGLKFHGYNLNEIQKRIPGKTEEQIQTAIDYFKAQLHKKVNGLHLSHRQRRKLKPLPQVPLAKWAELMTDTYDYKELQTECATALRIIADFENFPHPRLTENIDFRKLYHYMADAMEGKPIPDDPLVADVFNHCVMETSAMSKAYIPINELQDTLGRLGNNCSINIARPTKDGGLLALRYLAAQKNYNPLGVPEQYLRHPPSYTKNR